MARSRTRGCMIFRSSARSRPSLAARQRRCRGWKPPMASRHASGFSISPQSSTVINYLIHLVKFPICQLTFYFFHSSNFSKCLRYFIWNSSFFQRGQSFLLVSQYGWCNFFVTTSENKGVLLQYKISRQSCQIFIIGT